jgi:hypothetical protein
MDEAKKTTRELALELVDRLIDLETQRDAAAGLLLFARDKDTNQPLDWRPLVRTHCYDGEIIRGTVAHKYEPLKEYLLASEPDCPEVLSRLLSGPVSPVWERP